MYAIRSYYANITHHGKNHLAEILCLRLGMTFKFYLGQLADPVNQLRDIGTERDGNLFLGRNNFV